MAGGTSAPVPAEVGHAHPNTAAQHWKTIHPLTRLRGSDEPWKLSAQLSVSPGETGEIPAFHQLVQNEVYTEATTEMGEEPHSQKQASFSQQQVINWLICYPPSNDRGDLSGRE